jgi:hypothetical protein
MAQLRFEVFIAMAIAGLNYVTPQETATCVELVILL